MINATLHVTIILKVLMLYFTTTRHYFKSTVVIICVWHSILNIDYCRLLMCPQDKCSVFCHSGIGFHGVNFPRIVPVDRSMPNTVISHECSWHFKSLATWQFFNSMFKDSTKSLHYWPSVRELHWWPVDSPQRPVCRKRFFVMMSSWYVMVQCHPLYKKHVYQICTLIARFMGPTWGPHGTNRTQAGPMLAPWTLLSG